jgi:hypothetical protein
MDYLKRLRLLNGDKIMANIKLLKLITGEEILCEVLTSNADTIEIVRQVSIVVMPNPANPKASQIGLGPWMQFSDPDESIHIRRSALVCNPIDPRNEFIAEYGKTFSKLEIPTSPKILLPD